LIFLSVVFILASHPVFTASSDDQIIDVKFEDLSENQKNLIFGRGGPGKEASEMLKGIHFTVNSNWLYLWAVSKPGEHPSEEIVVPITYRLTGGGGRFTDKELDFALTESYYKRAYLDNHQYFIWIASGRNLGKAGEQNKIVVYAIAVRIQ